MVWSCQNLQGVSWKRVLLAHITHKVATTSKIPKCQVSPAKEPDKRKAFLGMSPRNSRIVLAGATLYVSTKNEHCNTLHHTATNCNTIQHTARHCNTLQHIYYNTSCFNICFILNSANCRRNWTNSLEGFYYGCPDCPISLRTRVYIHILHMHLWKHVGVCIYVCTYICIHMHVYTNTEIYVFLFEGFYYGFLFEGFYYWCCPISLRTWVHVCIFF